MIREQPGNSSWTQHRICPEALRQRALQGFEVGSAHQILPRLVPNCDDILLFRLHNRLTQPDSNVFLFLLLNFFDQSQGVIASDERNVFVCAEILKHFEELVWIG